jgi:hypothetical protein
MQYCIAPAALTTPTIPIQSAMAYRILLILVSGMPAGGEIIA